MRPPGPARRPGRGCVHHRRGLHRAVDRLLPQAPGTPAEHCTDRCQHRRFRRLWAQRWLADGQPARRRPPARQPVTAAAPRQHRPAARDSGRGAQRAAARRHRLPLPQRGRAVLRRALPGTGTQPARLPRRPVPPGHDRRRLPLVAPRTAGRAATGQQRLWRDLQPAHGDHSAGHARPGPGPGAGSAGCTDLRKYPSHRLATG